MKKLLLSAALFLTIISAQAQSDSSFVFVAGIRVGNKLSIDFGKGSKWKFFNEVYPEASAKAESDLDVIILMTSKGWDYVGVLPLQQTYSASFTPLLFKRRKR